MNQSGSERVRRIESYSFFLEFQRDTTARYDVYCLAFFAILSSQNLNMGGKPELAQQVTKRVSANRKRKERKKRLKEKEIHLFLIKNGEICFAVFLFIHFITLHSTHSLTHAPHLLPSLSLCLLHSLIYEKH